MTLDDVARLSGVSPATVSRVINEHPNIAEATREKVQAAMVELDYVPPPAEKRSRKRKNFPPGVKHGKIALLVPDADPAAMHTQLTTLLLDGISNVLGKAGIELQFVKLEPNGSLPSTVSKTKVDGVICKNWPKDPKIVKKLSDGTPVWCLTTPGQPRIGDQVGVDNTAAADLAIEYFADNDCRYVALLDSQGQELSQKARSDALESRAAHLGIEFAKYYVERLQQTNTAGAIGELLEGQGKVGGKIGIFLESAEWNYAAVGMELLRRDVQIGRDVELVCVAPSTSVLPAVDERAAIIDLQMQDVGQGAAEMLLWRLEHPGAQRRRLMVSPSILKP